PPYSITSSPLSLHDALPICDMFNQQGMNLVDVNVSDQSLARDDRQTDERSGSRGIATGGEEHADVDDLTVATTALDSGRGLIDLDRKSTRLNSSHVKISYAV